MFNEPLTTITSPFQGLSEGAEGLQSPFNPDDIADMFGNINLADTSGNNPFLPFMQGMMQSLLSAEILLPSLQDLCTKYPEWMTANAATVEPADKERYEKQLELMKSVITDLETEREDDSAEVKNERFQKVFGKMQRMQDLGQPPPELVEVGPLPDPSMFGGAMGNFPPGMMGGGGNPGDANGQPQCGMM